MGSAIYHAFRKPVISQLLALATISILLAGCAGTREIKTRVHYPDSNAVVRYALSLQGAPYRYGAESPREGFDCSGFVKHVYERHGVRLPRTAHQIAAAVPRIDSRNRQPGDLVFFNTTGQPFSHVGIYVGNDSFVHSSSVRGQVIVSSLERPYWWDRFLGVRRPSFPDRFVSHR
ncbi:C40 family peptidase [Methylocaldum sp.]|uniref:C40 family peptidase n=1 Tax=Methylocaldum sp. TaxID=1969727 RepID=UPI002D64F9E1|nr:C40 family peptidase [Methylocaldum sp.]HYE34867.1 C40 family peptidase [Methylocaldum sp.]